MDYSDLIRENASSQDIRNYLREGDQVAFTIRIPANLKQAAVDTADMRGMSFSAFVRYCMIQELARKD